MTHRRKSRTPRRRPRRRANIKHPVLRAVKRPRVRPYKRRHYTKLVYTARQLAALTPAQRAARDDALAVVALMRREGISLRQAARRLGVAPAIVRRYAGVALRRRRDGRVVAIPDRLLRRMQVLTADGKETINLRGSRAASIVGKHWAAVRKYLDEDDDSSLRDFTDVFPGGKRLATDPLVIDREARRSELDFEDIYDLSV